MKSTFGYTIRPTTALLLQPADYELRHVFRWHSGNSEVKTLLKKDYEVNLLKK